MAAYFAERGLTIDVDPAMKISELPHPKRPDEKGIDFLLTSCMLDPTLPAARQIAELNEMAEVRVNKVRAARMPGAAIPITGDIVINDNKPPPPAQAQQIAPARPRM